jgi:hypothetical protein
MDAAMMLPEGCEPGHYDAKLNAETRNELPGKEFAVPGTGQLPIHDAAHVRNAMARFGQTHFPDAAAKKTAYHKIVAKAKALGVDASGFESEHKDSSYMDSRSDMSETEKKALEEQLAIATKRAEDAEKLVKEHSLRADKAEGDAETYKARLDTIEQESSPAKFAELKASAEEANAKLEAETKKRLDAEDPERISGEVKRRVKIVLVARDVLGGGARTDELVKFEPRQLMSAVLERMPARYGGGKIETTDSEDKVSQRFATAVSFYEAGESAKKTVRESVRSDEAAKADPRSARERFIERQRALGTDPLSRKEV